MTFCVCVCFFCFFFNILVLFPIAKSLKNVIIGGKESFKPFRYFLSIDTGQVFLQVFAIKIHVPFLYLSVLLLSLKILRYFP